MEERTYVKGFHHESEVSKMSYRELGDTGLRVSQLSLGGGQFGGLYESLAQEEAVSIIQEAFRCGVNYIDTAPWYGQGKSEAVIGKALKHIPREAYYVATKVGRYEKTLDKMFDFSAQKTRESFQKSLDLLGLNYVDILQVHDIEFAEDLDQIVNETLPAVESLVKEGKARFIGLTGYPLSVLKDVVERSQVKVDVVLSYSRFTLIDQELDSYLPFFKERGIGVINAGLVSMGLLTPSGPPAWHPATEEIKRACHSARHYCQDKSVDISHLAIQYSLLSKGVSTHLVGAGTFNILKQNLETATQKPSEEDLAHIEDLRDRFFVPLSANNWEGNQGLAEFKEMRNKSQK